MIENNYDIFTGGNVDISITDQLDEIVDFHDPSYVDLPEVLAFPVIESTREISRYETYDSDTETLLPGGKTFNDTEITIGLIPGDPVQEMLETALDTKDPIRFRMLYHIDSVQDTAPGQIGYYKIFDAVVVGESTSGEMDSAVQKTYQLSIADMYPAGVARKGDPVMTGDWGIGAGTQHYPGVIDWLKLSGNRFVTFPGSTDQNPFGVDTGAIHVQGNDNQGWQMLVNSSGKPLMRVRNLSPAPQPWVKIYTSEEKPTPADVKAVALTGDTMTGTLKTPLVMASTFRFGNPTGTNNAETVRKIQTTDASGNGVDLVSLSYSNSTKLPTLETANINATTSLKDRGELVYSPLNKPTPGALGAVNKAGDTMSGVLTVPMNNGLRTATNTSSSTGETYYSSFSDEAGYAMMWRRPITPPTGKSFKSAEFIGINTNSAMIFRQDTTVAADTAAKYRDWQVYHQGFKPTPAELGAINVNDTIDLGTF